MKTKIAYYISTGLLTALMVMSAGMYFFNNAEVAKTWLGLDLPERLTAFEPDQSYFS